eukprot:SAG22_NODE_15295_length_352_cov_0.806324_1_plen_92_part_01
MLWCLLQYELPGNQCGKARQQSASNETDNQFNGQCSISGNTSSFTQSTPASSQRRIVLNVTACLHGACDASGDDLKDVTTWYIRQSTNVTIL